MNWQSWIASMLVISAAAWLGWRGWRMFRRALTGGPVADCGHCPRAKDSTAVTPLVQLKIQPSESSSPQSNRRRIHPN